MTSIRSTRVVLPDGMRPATVHVSDGTIVRISDHSETARHAPADLFDAGDFIVAPGLVDTHVHVNEPGRTEWEGFESATRAAAAGGVTTIVDMPLNSIPATTTVAALETKRHAARGHCHVDVAFWGGVVPGNAGELDELVDAGVRGFKCFLVPSGVDEFPAVDEADLRAAMPIIARRDVPLLVHAELPGYLMPLNHPAHPTQATDLTHSTHLAYARSRPPEAELEAVRMMIRLASEFGAQVHMVHVSCAEAADQIARAKKDGVRVTAETCPHYLSFASEEIPDGATEFKCAPPIRDGSHRAALWRALQAGTLDLVATDHSPAPPALKCAGDFGAAWGGIASLELSLPAVWTAGRHADPPPTPADLAGWMSEAPARLAALDARKGRIAVGFDADFCVWDPDERTTVDARRLQQRHKLTPYAGRTLIGTIRATFVRGVCVWDGQSIAAATGGILV